MCAVSDKVFVQSKLFLPGEEIVYVRLVRYALVALDIYTISSNIQGQMQIRPAVYVCAANRFPIALATILCEHFGRR